MPESLYRLVYISRNEIEGDETKIRHEIEQILETAREKNQAANITGALMFNAGCFAQVLEGTHQAVQATFERIQCDLRHSKLAILCFEPIENRHFAKWSMAYKGNQTEAAAKFAHIMELSGFDNNQLSGEHVFDLLLQHLVEAE